MALQPDDWKKIDNIRINFIVGPTRSGTTLLVVLLNQIRNCVATPEVKHFLYFYKKYKNVTIVSQELLTDYLNYFQLLYRSKQNLIFKGSGVPLLTEANIGDKINYSQLTKIMYLSMVEGKNDPGEITCIVDKNPFYSFHTEKILEIFPDAQFIVTMRDYHAFVLSNRQSQIPFIRVKSFFYYSFIWNYYADKVIRLLKEHPENTLLVKYEDLVLDKEKKVKEIVSFLGLKYDPSIFDFYLPMKEKLEATMKGKSHERALKKISDLSAPINPSRVHAWENTLKEGDKKKIAWICAANGNYFGYEAVAEPSWFDKMIYSILAVPGYLRVSVFYAINSVKLHHYLNVVRKAKLTKAANLKKG